MQKTENNEKIIEQMFQAGAHYGYSKTRRHPSVSSYIFATKNKTDIIDLEQTNVMLDEAKEFIKSLGAGNKVVLFVGTKRQAKESIEREAARSGMPYVSERWLGGTLTNWKTISQSIRRLRQLDALLVGGRGHPTGERGQGRLEGGLGGVHVGVDGVDHRVGEHGGGSRRRGSMGDGESGAPAGECAADPAVDRRRTGRRSGRGARVAAVSGGGAASGAEHRRGRRSGTGVPRGDATGWVSWWRAADRIPRTRR